MKFIVDNIVQFWNISFPFISISSSIIVNSVEFIKSVSVKILLVSDNIVVLMLISSFSLFSPLFHFKVILNGLFWM